LTWSLGKEVLVLGITADGDLKLSEAVSLTVIKALVS
jgi:hypothetical protein